MTRKINLYGIFGIEINAGNFANELLKLENEGCQSVIIYLNTDGGSVPDGIAMFNALRRSRMRATVVVDGLAASMGAAFLAVPNVTVKAYSYSKVMIHRVSGFIQGNPDEIEAELKAVRDFESDLVDMFSKKMNKTTDEIKARYFDGVNHWLTAREALEAGIVNEIIDSKLPEPKTLQNPREVYNHYAALITNRNNNSQIMKDSQRFVALLTLDKEANEDAIFEAVKQNIGKMSDLTTENSTLKATVADLQKKVDEQDKARVTAMIDAAVAAKKITAEERKHYEELAKANYDLCKNTLDKLPGHRSIMNQLGGDGKPDPQMEARKDWTFADWQRKDGKGLSKLKNEQPETYKSLYKAQFGKEAQL